MQRVAMPRQRFVGGCEVVRMLAASQREFTPIDLPTQVLQGIHVMSVDTRHADAAVNSQTDVRRR